MCKPDVNKRRGKILCHSPVAAYSCAFNEAVQTPPVWAEVNQQGGPWGYVKADKLKTFTTVHQSQGDGV